jgi:AcrR family transcriptional regulator
VPRLAAQNRFLREAARTRILDGSIAAFARKGFQAASMDDVAASAGVSKGLAYFYFKSKDELLVHALRERVAHLFEVGTALDREMPPGDRLAALVDALLTRVRKEPDVFRLYLTLSLERSLSRTAARTLRDLGAPLERYLAACRRVFEDLGSQDPELDALIFRSSLLGLFLRFVRSIEDVPIERLCARLLEIFQTRRVFHRRSVR